MTNDSRLTVDASTHDTSQYHNALPCSAREEKSSRVNVDATCSEVSTRKAKVEEAESAEQRGGVCCIFMQQVTHHISCYLSAAICSFRVSHTFSPRGVDVLILH